MNIDMNEFLRTGAILGLDLGLNVSTLTDKLNEPDDVIESGEFILSKYSGLEFTVQNDKLVIINLEFMDGVLELPSEFTMADEWQSKNIHDWVKLMEGAEIGWHICSESSYDDNLALVTEGNVLIYYSLIYEEIGKVQSASLNKKLYRYD